MPGSGQMSKLLESKESILSDRSSSNKVLIVDDNEYNLYVLQNYMRTVNISADEALNGKEALDAVDQRAKREKNNCYKLVVMDLNMPIMDGITATKELKHKIQEKQIPNVPIIALTAQPLKEEDYDYFKEQIGFAEYLTKPTTKDDFISLLKRYSVI